MGREGKGESEDGSSPIGEQGGALLFLFLLFFLLFIALPFVVEFLPASTHSLFSSQSSWTTLPCTSLASALETLIPPRSPNPEPQCPLSPSGQSRAAEKEEQRPMPSSLTTALFNLTKTTMMQRG
jgi:hypothetical protein